jgi:hypothetical protein
MKTKRMNISKKKKNKNKEKERKKKVKEKNEFENILQLAKYFKFILFFFI